MRCGGDQAVIAINTEVYATRNIVFINFCKEQWKKSTLML